MAKAIASLPWVEPDSVHADGKTLKAKFAVKNAKDFDEKAVIALLDKKGYPDAKLESGLTKK